ncbi:unnamed protein product [Urochloa humidicola]
MLRRPSPGCKEPNPRLPMRKFFSNWPAAVRSMLVGAGVLCLPCWNWGLEWVC